MRTPKTNAELRQTPIEGAKVLSLKVAADDLARLKEMAAKKDTSVSELIRVAIARLLDDDAAPTATTKAPPKAEPKAATTRPGTSRVLPPIKNHF